MGWSSACDIFDPVAQALIDANASDELKTRVLSKLIGKLQSEDWDTEDESLEQFKDDPAIVEAFRQHDILITCGNSPDSLTCCELGLGHASAHRDGGAEWPNEKGVGSVSPTDPAELGEWLRGLPERSALRDRTGDVWVRGHVGGFADGIWDNPALLFPGTTVARRLAEGHIDIGGLTNHAPFTVLALGTQDGDSDG